MLLQVIDAEKVIQPVIVVKLLFLLRETIVVTALIRPVARFGATRARRAGTDRYTAACARRHPPIRACGRAADL